MSNDYAFWKWRGRARISRGLCYLLVAEGAELPGVELLDIDRYRELIAKRLPSWEADDDPLPIDCRLLPTGICLQTYANTPTEVLQWFVDLSEADSLEFFDPQSEAISEQDKRDFHARLTAVEQAEAAAQWQKDLNHLLERVEASDPKALVDLGNRYSFGEGVQQDLARAFCPYLRAAEAGSEDGMFNVAACYRLGDGVEKNLLKAAEWYERALVKDKFFAPFALGELYSTPGGLPPDHEKPSPISRSHLHMVIKTHAASYAGSAPFHHFHRAQSEQTPKPSMMSGSANLRTRDLWSAREQVRMTRLTE